MRRRWVVGAVTLALWGGIGCQEKPPDVTPAGPNNPSQVLQHFQMQDIQLGEKTMTLDSSEGRMLDAQHRVDLERPIVTFFKKGSVSSVMTAPKGSVQTETHEVLAWGGVHVVTPDSTTLTTEHLRYDPQRKKLLSDDPVELEKPDSITDGIGLEAEPDLSQVKIGHEKVRFKKQPART